MPIINHVDQISRLQPWPLRFGASIFNGGSVDTSPSPATRQTKETGKIKGEKDLNRRLVGPSGFEPSKATQNQDGLDQLHDTEKGTTAGCHPNH